MTNDETAAALNEMEYLACRHWRVKGKRIVDADGIATSLRPQTARMVVEHKEFRAALKEISLLVNAGAMNQFHGEPWVDRMRAAIAKAEEKQ